jgi:hypothetical protein
MMTLIDWLKRYWKACAAGLLGLGYVLYRGKVREVAELSEANITATKEGELHVLIQQQQKAQHEAAVANANYDALLSSNHDLAAKLGIGAGSQSDPK